MAILEVIEGLLEQGTDEELVYSITMTPWVSSPSSASVKVFDEADELDVTSTVGAPTASTSGDVITLTELKDFTAGHSYRVEVAVVVGGAIYEPYFRIKCV